MVNTGTSESTLSETSNRLDESRGASSTLAVEPVKVVFAGPPHSGKSCLREGLKGAIASIEGAPYPYVITGAPDGEGAWFQEAVEADEEHALAAKKDYKGTFSDSFVQRVAESVSNYQEAFCMVDIGGRTSEENKHICATATHAVLLSSDLSKLEEWREFCRELGIKVIAEIHSDYNASEDRIDGIGSDGVLRGMVHHLERGEDLSGRPMIQALAQHAVSLTSQPTLDESQLVSAPEESSYLISKDHSSGFPIVKIGFNPSVPATNEVLVVDALRALNDQGLEGGPLLCFNGPASLPVAAALAGETAGLYGAIGCFDPKMSGYIIAISHSPDFPVGSFIPKDLDPEKSVMSQIAVTTVTEPGDTYRVEIASREKRLLSDGREIGETTVKVGFNPEKQAQNDVLVLDAVAACKRLNLEGGGILKITGPASLPVAMAVLHHVVHLYSAVAILDPKLEGAEKFVVTNSVDPDFKIGQKIA